MTVFASVSIATAVIPVITVLLLFALAAFVFAKRSMMISRETIDVQTEINKVIEDDQALEQTLVEQLVAGTSPSNAIPPYLQKRDALLRGATPDRPGHWDADHLEQRRNETLEKRIREINRRLQFPSAASALGIVAACVVAVAVLYANHQPEETDAQAETPPVSTQNEKQTSQPAPAPPTTPTIPFPAIDPNTFPPLPEDPQPSTTPSHQTSHRNRV